MITEQEQLMPGEKSYDIAFFFLPSLSHNCIVPYSLFSLLCLLSSCALLLRIVLALKQAAALLAAQPRITALAHSRCTDSRFTAAIHGRGCGDSTMRRLAGPDSNGMPEFTLDGIFPEREKPQQWSQSS